SEADLHCTCPHCGSRLNVPGPGRPGMKVKCPKCRAPFTVAEAAGRRREEPEDGPEDEAEGGQDLGRLRQQYQGFYLGGFMASLTFVGGGGLFLLVVSLGAALLNPALADSPWRWVVGVVGPVVGAAVMAIGLWLCYRLKHNGPRLDLYARGLSFTQ